MWYSSADSCSMFSCDVDARIYPKDGLLFFCTLATTPAIPVGNRRRGVPREPVQRIRGQGLRWISYSTVLHNRALIIRTSRPITYDPKQVVYEPPSRPSSRLVSSRERGTLSIKPTDAKGVVTPTSSHERPENASDLPAWRFEVPRIGSNAFDARL